MEIVEIVDALYAVGLLKLRSSASSAAPDDDSAVSAVSAVVHAFRVLASPITFHRHIFLPNRLIIDLTPSLQCTSIT